MNSSLVSLSFPLTNLNLCLFFSLSLHFNMDTQLLLSCSASMEASVSSLMDFLKVELVLASLQSLAFLQRFLLLCLTAEHLADNDLFKNKWISLSDVYEVTKAEGEAKDASDSENDDEDDDDDDGDGGDDDDDDDEDFSGGEESDDDGDPEEDMANGGAGSSDDDDDDDDDDSDDDDGDDDDEDDDDEEEDDDDEKQQPPQKKKK